MTAMTKPPTALLRHFFVDDAHPGVVTLIARQPDLGLYRLQVLLQEHRAFCVDRLACKGVLLIRGMKPETAEAFQVAMAEGLGVPPWNGFNLKGLPAFAGNWLRRYAEGLMGAGDYRRYLNRDAVQLGPAGDSIQGPHVEGGGSPRRARYLALCCFEPAAHQAETGMVDLAMAFTQLPRTLQAKYLGAFNTFYYLTARRLNVLDRLILAHSPIRVQEHLPDGRERLASPPTPAVCLHPQTGEPCLQPWAFARNTNRHALAAALEAFPTRRPLQPCPNAEGTHYLWGLADRQGRSLPWSDEEQRALFDLLYRRAHLMNWRKGDIAIVDNVRIGHWRMNGLQGRRKLVQVQLGTVDAMGMAPAELAQGSGVPPQMPGSQGPRHAA